jgi:hypothetical protein
MGLLGALGLTFTAGGLSTRTATIGFADLTDNVDGEAQSINVGAALPTGAVVVAAEVHLATPFSGGSVATLAIDVGGTDLDAIIDGVDGLGSAGYYSTPAGVKPTGTYSGQQLKATFTPDGGHDVEDLTAGSCTVTVWYTV